MKNLYLVLIVLGLGAGGLVAGAPCADSSGDVNADGGTDLSDAVYCLSFSFQGGAPPEPFCVPAGPKMPDCTILSGDGNGDGGIDLSDAIYILSFLFQGGPAPLPACPGAEVCNDSLDNDGDGDTDCVDPDCSGGLFCQTIVTTIIEDDFNSLASDMDWGQGSVGGFMEFPATGRWGSNLNHTKNKWDGNGFLEIPLEREAPARGQYIDSRSGDVWTWLTYSSPGTMPEFQETSFYALVCIFEMPTNGAVSIGFDADTTSANWGPPSAPNHRSVVVGSGGVLSLWNQDPAVTLLELTGNWTANTAQGIMITVAPGTHGTRTLRVWHQNGSDKSPDSSSWTEITPATDPDGLLVFPDTALHAGGEGQNRWMIGINTEAAGDPGAVVKCDYIALFKMP